MTKPKYQWIFVLAFVALLISACSAPLTTREQGGLIGGGLGAGGGAIIGEHGGSCCGRRFDRRPIGLIAGALIGDQLMGQSRIQDQQQRQIDQNAAELERLRRENQRLREESPRY